MSRRSRQISNHRSRRHTLQWAGAFLAIVGVLSTLFFLRAGSDVQNVPAQGEPTIVTPSLAPVEVDPGAGQPAVEEAPVDESNSQIVTVYVDGWTMKVLGTTKVRLQVEESAREAVLDFVPLNASAIRKAAAAHPEVLTDVMSRIVSGDRRMRCASESCSAGGTTFDPGVLAEASTIPGFGKMYDSWGISRGLWAAKVRVPKGGQIINFLANGYAGTTAIAGPAVGEGGEKVVLEDPDTGWGKNSYYIGASFGRLHLVMPAWRDSAPGADDAARMVARPAKGVSEGALDELLEIAARDPLSGGIADLGAQAVANGLNDYQLTYYSSPTTGCGAAALCVPGKISVKRSAVDVSDQLACNAEGTSVLIVSVRSTWTVKLPHTTHLAGVWGAGADPTAFDGSASMLSVLGYNGTPPLASGMKTFENLTWYAIDSLGLAVVAGSRAESADAIPLIDATMLDKLFGGIYSSCSK